MGWGTAKRAASPQPAMIGAVGNAKPVLVPDVQGIGDTPDAGHMSRTALAGRAKHALFNKTDAAARTSPAAPPDEDIIDPPPSKEHEAEMAWMKERSRWASDSANSIVIDFVRSQGLFGELIKFSKKRRR